MARNHRTNNVAYNTDESGPDVNWDTMPVFASTNCGNPPKTLKPAGPITGILVDIWTWDLWNMALDPRDYDIQCSKQTSKLRKYTKSHTKHSLCMRLSYEITDINTVRSSGVCWIAIAAPVWFHADQSYSWRQKIQHEQSVGLCGLANGVGIRTRTS
jgi:hypothetical protein